TVLALADFLEYLRQRDFRVGVDHSLRAQILLDKFSQHYSPEELLDTPGQPYPPEQLKSQLCSIFASNAEEQLRFDKVFDEYVGYRKRREKPVEPEIITPGPVRIERNWPRPAIVAAVLALALLVMLLGPQFRQKEPD